MKAPPKYDGWEGWRKINAKHYPKLVKLSDAELEAYWAQFREQNKYDGRNPRWCDI